MKTADLDHVRAQANLCDACMNLQQVQHWHACYATSVQLAGEGA